jgi:hypothetical protein
MHKSLDFREEAHLLDQDQWGFGSFVMVTLNN